jgi:hypothetical protein
MAEGRVEGKDRGSGMLPAAALVALFFGGAALGEGLSGWLVPGSRVAEVVSFFALPLATAAGLTLCHGAALLAVIGRGVRRAASGRPASGPIRVAGTWIFLPRSSAAGGRAGLVAGLSPAAASLWPVLAAYWITGTRDGLVAWPLARRSW